MTEPKETKTWPTGWLWGILAVLLVFGTVGSAGVVYGVTGFLAGDWLALVAIPIGGFVGVVSFLFIAGILYRVDKFRGVAERRIELFE